MVFVKDEIRKTVQEGLVKFPPEFLSSIPKEIKIEYPAEESHGDFSATVAFEISKTLKKNPRAVAEELVSHLKKPAWISKIEIAGPGFINFFLAPEFVTKFPETVIKEGENFGKSEIGKGKTIATDISHPNVAKPMGAHHLLSTIIGDSLNKIFSAVGYHVIRDNYLGDWGTQFGKLIYAYKTWGDETTVKKNPIPELLKLYVKFHDEAERNPRLEEFGRAEFKKLEDGDKENKKLWQWVVDLSLHEFHKIWKRLGVSFDFIHGESFYEDKMPAILELGIKKKIFVAGERGALIAPFSHDRYPPCIVKKSDGATTYATRDLARTKYWENTWHPDMMVMVVDMAQTMHFQQFFEVAKMLDITKARNMHVAFGRMRFPEKKMSTRKGNILLLEKLLDEVEALAYEIVREKNPELSEEKKREVARKVGIGAVKYAVLGQNRMTDVTFTWEKMLSLEGNSAPYLQYVYARGRAILRKSGGGIEQGALPIGRQAEGVLKEPQELAVARFLPRFPEIVAQAAEECKPNLVANFLFELASRFNSFYAAVPVLQAQESIRGVRLRLVEAATVVLKNGLALLGIEAPEEM